MQERLRVLIFILAYNAEKTVTSVLDRIPRELEQRYDVRVLVIEHYQETEQSCIRVTSFICKG